MRHVWVRSVGFRMVCKLCGKIWHPHQAETETGKCPGKRQK